MSVVCRIVHFSDLHLTAKDSDYRYEPTFPHKRLRGMNEAFKTLLKETAVKKADHIIVTGDITDKGELKAWKKFKQYTDETGLTKKTSIVIGNHDICQLGRWSFKFRKKDWRKRALNNKRNLMRRLTAIDQSYDYPWFLRINEHVSIFGIDSNNAGNWGDASNAMGEIGTEQLRAFARLLKINKNVPVKFAALHHSPNLPEKSIKVPPKSWLQKRYTRYTHEIPESQRRAFRLMCASHGVKRIIHGHMHEYHSRPLCKGRCKSDPRRR
jgi:3',5'-cyclic-AMP phosphodiesterase